MWHAIKRWFGFHRQARIQITAPGVEVTLVGEPSEVRALLGVIRTELERRARRDHRLRKGHDDVVQPTELDEADSPYALPEAVVVPVADESAHTRRDPRRARLVAMTAREGQVTRAPTPALASEPFGPEDVESVRTALTPYPDEGPTPPLAAALGSARGTDPDVFELEAPKRAMAAGRSISSTLPEVDSVKTPEPS